MTHPGHLPVGCSWDLVGPRAGRSGAERLFRSSWSTRGELQGCKARGAWLLLLKGSSAPLLEQLLSTSFCRLQNLPFLGFLRAFGLPSSLC